MLRLLEIILSWSEAWAPLLPLIVLSNKQHKQPSFLKPVIIYLWIAFFLHLFADIYTDFKNTDFFKKQFPGWKGNNVLYNIHSVVLFICFSYFFISLKRNIYLILRVTLLILFPVLVIINFTQLPEENFFKEKLLSGNLLSIAAYLLLIYCMQYYLSQLRDDIEIISRGPAFWIVTGLSIYVVVNFFVFLFYVPMAQLKNMQLVTQIWNVHNIAYIIFCIFITIAFYEPVRHQLTI